MNIVRNLNWFPRLRVQYFIAAVPVPLPLLLTDSNYHYLLAIQIYGGIGLEASQCLPNTDKPPPFKIYFVISFKTTLKSYYSTQLVIMQSQRCLTLLVMKNSLIYVDRWHGR